MYKNILVPIDGSEPSTRALQEAISLCWGREQECSITLLHVNPLHVYYAEGVIFTETGLEDSVRKEGEQIVDAAAAKLRRTAISFETVSELGYPAEKICEYAKQNKCDVIIMGSRGLGAFGQFILGSVSHKVLHYANCPVLIVK